MRLPFLLFLLFLLGVVLSLVLIDGLGTSRLETPPMEAVRPNQSLLLPPPSRS